MTNILSNLTNELQDIFSLEKLYKQNKSSHKARILLLYGSNRMPSFSRLLVQEATILLNFLGAETRIFDPYGLPLPDTAIDSHNKVAELQQLMQWSEGQVWCSPEHHGSVSAVFKSQLDWITLETGLSCPIQGKTLAVLQVNGGAQSFNVVNQLRIIGRYMKMFTIPNHLSVPQAFLEFEETGRMKASFYYDRLVDVMEELLKFTLILRDKRQYFLDRYSERHK
ncbi:arsenical resistance protein ArsH [Xenorhabdus nematophila]|uniref:Arsenical resistance protein ArsH n=1 Tax=Xenorhabdus nematophila (strain ATCC 19061 / DSM 3370 / CCUG 14189 / LMG 1036 / NCIMB 9965 / AN6) TaxID=406817 RepID=D3VJC9_XENNA|nr:arsenical resistance protein ArsH [Xenorhabdus nematophila]CEE90726.1 putative Arsenical resistance protein ArsH [Xenorhabdus nematophila str. Anatoliense]CBJ88685.1 putative Arsenical resistance protein ArsH [Xenorhabdus nematophila ATCC 19061]CCW31921.1 putative Arsenical resistance protein ArsH [Xenorhabdus nematophila F1]CEE95090.1 putative Arsenical resistance protein ArsH [Xenorhabdus nematophila str. Anatoliense]CEK21597.1 putative Arsenical resistance protein ArsH [Xenorhabdus nemat